MKKQSYDRQMVFLDADDYFSKNSNIILLEMIRTALT